MDHSLVYVLLGLTLLALVVGVFSLLRAGQKGQKFSQRMMIARVALQALTLVVVAALMLTSRH